MATVRRNCTSGPGHRNCTLTLEKQLLSEIVAHAVRRHIKRGGRDLPFICPCPLACPRLVVIHCMRSRPGEWGSSPPGSRMQQSHNPRHLNYGDSFPTHALAEQNFQRSCLPLHFTRGRHSNTIGGVFANWGFRAKPIRQMEDAHKVAVFLRATIDGFSITLKYRSAVTKSTRQGNHP